MGRHAGLRLTEDMHRRGCVADDSGHHLLRQRACLLRDIGKRNSASRRRHMVCDAEASNGLKTGRLVALF